ncbi:MAG: hypothetical protein ACTHJW_04565 [Streptosporangiaceae bacterium]
MEPASLDALSARISGVAGSTASARGGLVRAANATAGCQEPAAGAFMRLQTLLGGAMQCLDDCSLALARAVSQAAAAYVTTDVTQMSAGGQATPR